MRVRAIQPGFYNGLHIPETDSEEFDVPDDEPKATWFEPVKKKGKERGAADASTSDQANAGGLV